MRLTGGSKGQEVFYLFSLVCVRFISVYLFLLNLYLFFCLFEYSLNKLAILKRSVMVYREVYTSV